MKLSGKRVLDHAIAFLTIFFWGLTFLSTKHLEEEFSALEILFIRYAIAYIALLLMRPKFVGFLGWKREGMIFLASMAGAGLYQFLENLSVVYTTPASVSFISTVAPLFTAVLAHFALREPLRPAHIVGMLVSLVGVFFICFGDATGFETGLLGDVIILCSVWLWAVYSVLIKKIEVYGIDDFILTRRIFFYSIVAMIPFLAPTVPTFPFHALTHLPSVLRLLFLGVVASAVCFACWNRSVERLGASATSKYMFVMPIITLVAEAIVMDTDIVPLSVFGMFLTLVGLALTRVDFGKVFRKAKKPLQKGNDNEQV